MSDQITRLLEHYASDLTDGAPVPTAPEVTPARHVWRRRYLLPATAAASVAAVAAGVVLATDRVSDRVRTVYATDGPELGTAQLPLDVTGRPGGTSARPGAMPVGVSDLLATAPNRKGTAALLGQHYSDGALCVIVGYLRPTANQGSSWSCDAHGKVPGSSDSVVLLGGEGPSGAPGGIKDPALAYGSAPPGTRKVELTSPNAAAVVEHTYDGGPEYAHRAFFIVSWDLAVKTHVRALDEDGNLLAALDIPFHPMTPEMLEAQCKGVRLAMRGHFQRAVGLARKGTSSEGAGGRRPPPAVQDASTDDGAGALLTAAVNDVALMADEERYEYRLAANVITGEGQCFTDPALRGIAEHYQSVSR